MIRSKLQFKLIAGLILVVSIFALTNLRPQTANALSGSDFNAGKIIDDTVFFNGNAMSATDIQSFLNAKVPSCDTNGTQASTHWYSAGNRYYTRAEWGAQSGNNPPYTCLRNYTENTPSRSADAYCAGNYTGGNKTAAQIIDDVSRACSVSQKTLLVLLQKEQSLVTDSWPWSIQYRSATGYGCPDTAACDSTYYGFFNQVYAAARQFQRYAKQPTLYNYRGARTSYIQYNPNASCGGSNVYIHNAATAGLYNYTPYQPNASALNNLYGSGDSCGAYGNRNFWRLFNDWFGLDPNGMIMNGVTMRTIAAPDNSPARGQTVTYTVSFTNNLSVNLAIDAIGIVGRYGNINSGPNRDFGWVGPITLNAGATQQYSFTTPIRDVGTIYAWPAISYQGTYVHYNNWGTAMQSHAPKLSVTTPLTSSVSNPVAGQTGTLSATITNNEDQALLLDTVGIPVRYYGTYNYDTAWASSSSVIEPAETKVISGNLTFDKTGPYTAWVSAVVGGYYNTLSSDLNLTATRLAPNFSMTYIEGPNTSPALGEDVAVKFKLKNNLGVGITLGAVGVVGRYDNPYNGPNRDFGWVGPETFTAGEEKTYTAFTSNVSELKNFYAWVAINYQGTYTHYNNWGFMMVPRIPNISLSSPLTINSGVTPTLGQPVSVTATVKNNEPKAIKYNAVGIAARYYGVYNYDAVWEGSGTLSASGELGDSNSLSGTMTFDKSGPYSVWTSININGRYIELGSRSNLVF